MHFRFACYRNPHQGADRLPRRPRGRGGHPGAGQGSPLCEQARAPAILAGTRPPAPTQDGYVTMGGPDEATDYLREFGQAWKDTPGAVDWLAGNSDTAPPKRRSSKRNT